MRYYTKKENDLCPPDKPQRVRSKSGGSGLLYTIGAFTLVGGGTIAYANYDPNFRSWLGENVPYSDGVLKFILQEEKTYWENVTSAFDDMKDSFVGLFSGESSKRKKVGVEQIEEVPKDYKRKYGIFCVIFN